MNKKLISVCLLSFGVGQVMAAGDPVPYSFVAGTPAKASEVNTNFQELADRVATKYSETLYNYQDYSAANSVDSLTYNVSVHNEGLWADIDQIVHEFSRTSTSLTVLDKRYKTGVAKMCMRLTYEIDSKGKHLTKREEDFNNNKDCTSIHRTFDLLKPLTTKKTDMKIGVPFGGSIEATFDSETLFGIDTSVLLGTEDISLTVNGSPTTYTGCLKIEKVRTFKYWGGQYRRIQWNCPGVGMARMYETGVRYNPVTTQVDISSRKRELTATN